MKLKKKQKEKITALFLMVLVLLVYQFISIIKPTQSEQEEKINYIIPEGELVVKYIDVGQADCIFISSSGQNAIIDGGNEEDGPKVVEYLKNIGITKIDYVIGTHPHEDHIGGLDDIINNFNVQTIYLPRVTTTTKTFSNLLDAIENNNLSITIPNIGDQIKIGEATMEIIYTGEDESDLNSSSIISKLTYGKYSFLFTGDTTSKIEKLIIDKNINIDFLKVAHHGSEYSTSNEFLAASTPKYAIISVGENNPYNHPSSKTINRIKKYTNEIYLTSELGTITISINKEDLKIYYEKTDTNGGE